MMVHCNDTALPLDVLHARPLHCGAQKHIQKHKRQQCILNQKRQPHFDPVELMEADGWIAIDQCPQHTQLVRHPVHATLC